MKNDRNLIKITSQEILQVVKNVFKKQLRGIEIIPGIVSVLHTFGEDMKFNVHFHCIITAGGVNEDGDWFNLDFFFYEGLRKVWQYHVLTAMKEYLPKTVENSKFIDKMFKDHPDGFYVRAKDKVNREKGLIQYIMRYVRHPAIAQSRITVFDGQNVTFVCKKDEEDRQRIITMPVQEFILALIQHINPKGFQLIKHLGIYSNRGRRKYASVICKFQQLKKIIQKKLFEHVPRCKTCNSVMEVLEISSPTDPPPRLLLSSYLG